MSFTIEKILDYITPQDEISSTQIHISVEDYEVRKRLLKNDLNKLLDNLRVNHFTLIKNICENVPNNITPLNFLIYVRKLSFSNDKFKIIYLYLVELYSIIVQMKNNKNNVINIIKYEEIKYD